MAAGAIAEKIRRIAYAWEDRLFDWRHNIDTGGVIAVPDLATGDGEADSHATAYQPVWTRNLCALVGQARQVANTQVFVDIGAGKGKACFYAASRFERVIGVEYSALLVNAAKANLQRAGVANVEFVQADARQYDIPDQPCLVFMFNPFDGQTLAQFIARNRERMKAHAGLLAYANDLHREVLQDAGFACVFRDARRSISLWR
jgi:precorrin-6B methylase 2